MITAKCETIQLNGKGYTKGVLFFKTKPHYSLEVEFKSKEQLLNIYYCSKGFISDNKIKLASTPNSLEFIVEHMADTAAIVTCQENQNIVRSATIPLHVDVIGLNKESEAAAIDKRASSKSAWRFILETHENVCLRTIKFGPSIATLAFGENTEYLSMSDFVFKVYPQTPKIIIPKELLWIKHKHYSANARLGCFLVTQPSGVEINNLYNKTLVSNTLDIESFPKMESSMALSDFKTPTGQKFNPSEWLVKYNLVSKV